MPPTHAASPLTLLCLLCLLAACDEMHARADAGVLACPSPPGCVCCVQVSEGVCHSDFVTGEICDGGAWSCGPGMMRRDRCTAFFEDVDSGTLAPRRYGGAMAGTMGGFTFTASVALRLDVSRNVSATWRGSGRFAEWRGGVDGTADEGGQVRARVSMVAPAPLSVIGELTGTLSAGSGGGRWRVRVSDAFSDGGVGLTGEGTWDVR